MLFTTKKVVDCRFYTLLLMAGKVRKLICSSDFHAEGFVCPRGHFLTAEVPQGIICKRNFEKRAFFEDELIEEAISRKIELFHLLFFQRAGILEGPLPMTNFDTF